MVRFKNRYFLVEIVPEDVYKENKEERTIQEKDIHTVIIKAYYIFWSYRV